MTFSIIVVVILIGGLIFMFRHWQNHQREEVVSDILITTGLQLIFTSFGTLDDKLFAFLSNKEVVNNYVQLGTGFVLLVGGIYLYRHIKNKLYILNINGMFHERRIENHHQDLGMNQFQFKEKEVDFVRVLKKGISPDVVLDIQEEMSHKIESFKLESKDKKRGYTGIAPIPFIMMAGKMFERQRMDEYFEFDKFTETYYQLANKFFRTKYPKLSKRTQDPYSQFNVITCEEIAIAVSLTSQITDEQLSQFSCPHIHLSVPEPTDNLIKYKEQLKEYVETTYQLILVVHQKLPKLKTIHFLFSGQSCFAFEMGKLIDDNRMQTIINYTYKASERPKYPWGIVLNGDQKGTYVVPN
jgi:hypothetical protein